MGTEIGTLAVRRSIYIKASPERVWQEFETFERMRAWFGTGHRLLEYEPKLGGHVLLEIDYVPKGAGRDHEARIRRFGGAIVVFEPARELTFENDWVPNEGADAPSLITLRLTPALDGTVVELFHHAIEREGGEFAERLRGLESGWTTRQLEALRTIVEG